MKQEIKDEWVKRLESGQYQQGQGHLRTEDDKYCCLGVLCEMAVEQGVIERWHRDYDDGSGAWFYGEKSDSHLQSTVDLPRPVQEWAGLELQSVWVTVDPDDAGIKHTLDVIGLNDDRSWGFKEIAEAVRTSEAKP